MKRVLFISISEYNPKGSNIHLAKKFEGLSKHIRVFLIGRGKNSASNVWNSNFYLVRSRMFYFPAAILAGSYLCLFKKIDTIVCQSPLTEGLAGVFLKVLFRKELIIEIHGDWREGPFINKKRLFAPILRKMVPYIGRFSLSRADKVRTLTRLVGHEVRDEFPGKKYFAFPTFTDIDIFLEEKKATLQKYICTAAVLSPIKNIETLIEAFAKIHSKFSDFKLFIIGSGLTGQKLRVMSYELRVPDRVVFTGQLSQGELKNIMKDCYAFALPSLSEGFGRVFIEAMALGKPVIGSNVGGVPEIIRDGENGFLIEPKDASMLAEKLEYLLSNPETAKKMGEAGQKFVRENFSNEKYIRNYVEMIYS